MAEQGKVVVRTATLELTTTKLTKNILRQMPRVSYDTVRKLLKKPDDPAKEQFSDDIVVGWIHGSVFGDPHDRWLLLKTGDNEYGLLNVLSGTIEHFKEQGMKQIYVV